MKKIRIITALLIIFVIIFSGCSSGQSEDLGYKRVNAEEAKTMMDENSDYVILDVRTQSEYDEGHIPGAVLLPYDTVPEKAEQVLPDKAQLIFVYCRSGNRSVKASESLVKLGYTNVVEFGGIKSWPYEIEK